MYDRGATLQTLYAQYQAEYKKMSSTYTCLYDIMLDRWCNQFEAVKPQIKLHLYDLGRMHVDRHDEGHHTLAPTTGEVRQFMEHAPIKEILDKIHQEFLYFFFNIL